MAYTIPRAFFAYPSSQPLLSESIREAARQINTGGRVEIQTWEDYRSGGSFIIDTICAAIDEAELFFADITGFNPNVMFELGYAIACDKRIWLVFDPTYPKEKKMFSELQVLSTIEYVSFSNSQEIVSGFYKNNPVDDRENTIFRTAILPRLEPGGYHSILHLKSKHEDEAAISVSHLLGQRLSNRGVIVDDPSESTIPSLAWYGSHVLGCAGLVCHFASPKREGAHIQTARHALVCGMARGFKKPLLMLAEGDFLSPVDYRDYLKHYNTAREAHKHLKEWLSPVEQVLKDKRAAAQVQHPVQFSTDLKSLRFGEPVAENEEESLVERYFIPTAAYNYAVNGNQSLFVGRKGAGKTANLMKLKDELNKNPQNLVCEIRPPSYQIQGVVELLKELQSEQVQGYAIESLWKFLLLTEVASTAFNALTNSLDLANPEAQNFYSFVRQNEEVICADLPTRLGSCIQNLKRAIGASNTGNSYLPISEALHSGILRQLRVELGEYLSKKQRVAILVDNLDKAWDQQNEIEMLSEILWSLLEVAKKLPEELERRDSRKQGIQLSLAVFLRSDIFYRIREVAHEPDKMPYALLSWDYPESLYHIIEERFRSFFEEDQAPDVLWDQYFCPTINGISTREYITSTILKRPRDIIFFVNAAVTIAVNRRRTRIEKVDILEAEKQYSQYAFDSVKVENTLPDINLEDVLFEFVGMPAILTKREVLGTLQSAGIAEEMIEATIDVLCDLTFLGLETREDKFDFTDVPEESRKNKMLAQKFAMRTQQEERLQVHKAFRAFLETEEI